MPPSAIVIGAGVAGLIAAQTLRNASFNVVVLEARQRIGGRISSETLFSNITVDAGAAWLEGVKGNPLAQLASSAGIKTQITTWDNFLTLTSKGKPVAPSDMKKAETLFTNFFDWVAITNDDGKFNTTSSLEDALQKFLATKPKPSTAVMQTLRWKLAFEVEEEYAAPLSSLSAMYFDSDTAYTGDYAMFPAGYSQVMRVLAAGLDVRYGDPVGTVTMQNNSIVIRTLRGTTYSAKYVVCTLPLGVLKAGVVRFVPALPARKALAIRRLGFGLLDKIILLFPEKFWDENYDLLDGFGQVNGQAGSPWPSLLFLDRVVGAPVVVAFNFGAQARHLERATDAQNVAEAMTVIRTSFGANVPDPIAHLITRWEADPFSRGAYSFIAAGAIPDDFTELARPIKSPNGGSLLTFAGEATSRTRPGTAPGAYLSGRLAAQRIIDQANLTTSKP
eukprot:jgi/Botrbrau1/15067/Bobra.118_2s0015.1